MRRTCAVLMLVIGCSGAGDKTGGTGGLAGGDAAAGAVGTDGGGMFAPGPDGSILGGVSDGAAGSRGTDSAASSADGPATAQSDSSSSPDTAGSPLADAGTSIPDGSNPLPDASVLPDTSIAPPDADSLPADTSTAPPPDASSAPADAMAMGPSPDASAPPPDSAAPPPDAGPPACTPASTIGCPTGQWCSAATHTCLTATGSLHWTFTDSCQLAGAQADVKLFDQTHGGAWPADGIIYVVPFGQTKTIDIACIPGATVCYGAEDHTTGVIFWGVGLSNNHSCASCCTTCSPPGNVQPQNLTCM
jgi:hypothetical protein